MRSCRQQGKRAVKLLLKQNRPVLNWGCRLTQVDLYNGHKTVVFLLLLLLLLLLLDFAWVVDDAKCIVVTRVCLSVCVCVCLSIFLSAAIRPHYCTDPDVTWGRGRGCPLVVHYWADLQSVHGFRCCGSITRTQNVSEYMLVLARCLVVVIVVTPHCSTTYVDAAYCYRWSSVVCRSVCWSVCHGRESCKNGWNDRDAVWTMNSGGPTEPCIRRGSRSPMGRGNIEWARGGPL